MGPFEKIVDQIRGLCNCGSRFGAPLKKSVAMPLARALCRPFQIHALFHRQGTREPCKMYYSTGGVHWICITGQGVPDTIFAFFHRGPGDPVDYFTGGSSAQSQVERGNSRYLDRLGTLWMGSKIYLGNMFLAPGLCSTHES